MNELIHQLTTTQDVRRSEPAWGRMKRFVPQKAFAALFGFLLLGAILAPMAQSWHATPKDSFPFSYYPMFSEKRGKVYTVNYIVGLDGDGHRYLIPHRFAGNGGFNQTRRQINRLEREDKSDKLCRAIAGKVGREAALPYSGIASVRVVTGRFRFAEYFSGNKTPLSERVRASCQVARGAENTEGEP